MASSPSPLLRVELQAAGENLNAWGAPKLNLALTDLEFAIAGRTAFALSGSKTLTATNYTADEARSAILDVTSGSGGTITIPAVSKLYMVRNASSGDVTVTTGSGATAIVPTGGLQFVVSNGTDVYTQNVVVTGITPSQLSTGHPTWDSSGNLTAVSFIGPVTGAVTGNVTGNLTGNVTGNVSGSSGSTTGNAATATKLATARAIQISGAVAGTANFDGSAAINIVTTAGSTPGIVAAVYCTVTAGVVTVQNSYNIFGVVRNSAGNYTVTYNVAISTAYPYLGGFAQKASANNAITMAIDRSVSPTTGGITLGFVDNGASATDPAAFSLSVLA